MITQINEQNLALLASHQTKTIWPENQVETTREKLLSGVLRLLAEGGPDAFSLNTLLKRTGLSKGAFYHYFDSLEELLLESLRYRKSERVVDAEKEFEKYSDLKSFLFDYFQQMLSFAASPEFLNLLLYFNQKGLNQSQIRDELCLNNNAVFERLSRIIQYYYPQTIEKQRLQSVCVKSLANEWLQEAARQQKQQRLL